MLTTRKNFSLQISGSLKTKLNNSIRRTKIVYDNTNPYNKRWHFKWRSAYYSTPKETEHTRVKTPEDSQLVSNYMSSWYGQFERRISPALGLAWQRKSRMYDNFTCYALPGFAFVNSLFWDLNLGFKILTLLPLGILYTRIRDKTVDPDLKETYLREMLHTNEELNKYFSVDTMYVIDYDLEYDAGIPCAEKFPEFQNKYFQFFNTDSSMCTGYFVFGDVESGATMRVDLKTMPIASGASRYEISEPFFLYNCVATVNNNGVFSEVVLVDEKETLKKHRPFVFLY